jgi:hypothetical protein
MNQRIYRFQVEITGDVPAYQTHPVYDESGTLVGGFTLLHGDVVTGFIAGVGYPLALSVSTDAPFYFTPREGPDGKVSKGVISDKQISVNSKRVSGAYDEKDAATQE